MTIRVRPLLLAVALALAAPPAASAAPAPGGTTLHVFAAASLSDAFGDLAIRFERAHPGVAVRLNLAGSQQLAAQLEQGAQADVFATADSRWMDEAENGALLAGEPVVFARNRLVVIVPRKNVAHIARLEDLARAGVKLVLGADAVPVGHYSRVVLKNLSAVPGFGADFAARVLANVVSEEENVRSVAGKVRLGEADAGIVYRSDLTPSLAREVRAIGIPDSVNAIAQYPIAVVRASRQPDLARAFIALVLSPDGRSALQQRGLMPPAAP